MNPNPFGRLGIDITQPVVAEPDSTPVEPAAPVREVAIIGSGPAGYTAAIYCARNGLAPVCVEGSVDRGGALMNTSAVDTFPGFPEGVLGPDLMAGMRAQAERFGAEFVTDDAVAVELGAEPKEIKTAESGTLRARTVILAMGSGHRKLGLPAEERLSGKGVSWCATCDGFFFKGKDIAVVGGGDSAAEEATFLTRFANSVSLIHRRDRLRASHVMADRVARDPKIKIVWNSAIVDLRGTQALAGLALRDTLTGERSELAVQGLFVAIGHEPRSQLVAGQVALDPDGYVYVDRDTTQTSLPGVFACGDLVDRRYRQAITAAGSGCRAALDAGRYLADRP